MTEPAGYLAIALAFFVVAASPGPANIANAVIAMDRGRAASLRFGAGLTFGIAVWGLVAATGLGAVLQSSVVVLSTLKILGAAYLFWLAWQSGRDAMKPRTAPDKVAESSRGRTWFWRGVVMNLSNPKTVVAWMAALAVGLTAHASAGALAIGVAVCVAVALVVNAAYTLIFSMDGMMAVYQRVRRAVGLAVAGLFAVAGLGLLRSAFTR